MILNILKTDMDYIITFILMFLKSLEEGTK